MNRKLALVHALDENALIFNHMQNGMANPSLAYAPIDIPYDHYGEIILVKSHDTNDDFSDSILTLMDGYTPLTPEIMYKTDKWKIANYEDKLQLKLSESHKGKVSIIDSVIERHLEYGISHIDHLKANFIMKIAYLADEGHEVPPIINHSKKEEGFSYSFIDEQCLSSLSHLHRGDDNEDFDKKASDIIEQSVERIREKIKTTEDKKTLRKLKISVRLYEGYLSEGVVKPSVIDQSYLDAKNSGSLYVNEEDMNTVLDSKYLHLFESDDYDSWCKNMIVDCVSEPYFITVNEFGNEIETERRLATLDSISNDMSKDYKDNAYLATVSSLAARLVDPVSSLDDVVTNAHKLTTTEVYEQDKKGFSDAVEKFLNNLSRVYKYKDNMSGYTELESSILTALKSDGYSLSPVVFNLKDYPEAESDFDSLKELAKNLRHCYFERKYDRPVKINEFSYAIVPKGISSFAKSLLSKNGLKPVYYEKGNDMSLVKAMHKCKDAHIKTKYEVAIENKQKKQKSSIGLEI